MKKLTPKGYVLPPIRRDYEAELGVEKGAAPSTSQLRQWLDKEVIRKGQLGKFVSTLDSLETLQRYGNLRQFKLKRQRFFKTRREYRALVECFVNEPAMRRRLLGQHTSRDLRALRHMMRAQERVIAVAEIRLKNDGWEYDPSTGQCCPRSGRTKPESLFNNLVRAIAKNAGGFSNTKELRRFISKLLIMFPSDWTDPRSGRPIDRALTNFKG